jgi:hypothetical protein
MNITSISSGISYTGGFFGGKNVDWSKIPTKDYNSPPPGDIRSMVRQNAREYANAATDDERTRLKNQAETLFHKYVSHAAPDRKKLLAGAQNAKNVIEGTAPLNIEITRSKNMIDYFIEAQFKNGTQKRIKEISFDGGAVVKEGDGRYTVTLGGEAAISITGSGITFIPSQAELNSQREIVDFWERNRAGAVAENQARGIYPGGIDIKA